MRTLLEVIAVLLLAVLLGGCSLPSGTRKITFWGVGCIPVGAWCAPFVGYWASEHGDETDNYNPAKPPNTGSFPAAPLMP
jgi:hypothetical protein